MRIISALGLSVCLFGCGKATVPPFVGALSNGVNYSAVFVNNDSNSSNAVGSTWTCSTSCDSLPFTILVFNSTPDKNSGWGLYGIDVNNPTMKFQAIGNNETLTLALYDSSGNYIQSVQYPVQTTPRTLTINNIEFH
jgi:hypothetical protein